MNEEEDILSLFGVAAEENQSVQIKPIKKTNLEDERIKVFYAEMLPEKTHRNKEKNDKKTTNEKYISLKKATPILVISFFIGFGVMLWWLWG